jgi:hypothetical protein
VTLPDGGQSGTRGHGAGASLFVAQIPMQSMNHGEARRKNEDQVGKEGIWRKAQKPIARLATRIICSCPNCILVFKISWVGARDDHRVFLIHGLGFQTPVRGTYFYLFRRPLHLVWVRRFT